MISVASFALSMRVYGTRPPVGGGAWQWPGIAVAGHRLPHNDENATVVVLRPPAACLWSAQWNSRKLRQASEVVRSRLQQIGVESPSVTVDTVANTLTVRVPVGHSAQYVAHLLTRPAALEFRYVRQLDSEWHTQPAVVHGRQTWFEALIGADGTRVPARALATVFDHPPAFTGADLMTNCRAELLPNAAVLKFEFKEGQKRRFEAFTRAHIDKPLAIFLDHKLLTAPVINAAIPGAGVIMARFPLEEARILAIQLNSGSLPVSLEVVRRAPGGQTLPKPGARARQRA